MGLESVVPDISIQLGSVGKLVGFSLIIFGDLAFSTDRIEMLCCRIENTRRIIDIETIKIGTQPVIIDTSTKSVVVGDAFNKTSYFIRNLILLVDATAL